MKKCKKLLCLILVAAMAVSVAACGKTEGAADNPGSTSGADTQTQKSAEFAYVASYFNLPEEINYVNSIGAYGDKVYILGDTYDDNWNYTPKLYIMNADGSDIQETTLSMSGNVNRMVVDGSGNIWMVTYEYITEGEGNTGEAMPLDETAEPVAGAGEDDAIADETAESDVTEEPEGTEDAAGGEGTVERIVTGGMVSVAASSVAVAAGDYGDDYVQGREVYMLYKMSAQGDVLFSMELNALAQDRDYFYVNNITVDSGGKIYLTCDDTLFILDETGNPISSLQPGNWIESVVRTQSGEIILGYYGDNGIQYSILNQETGEIGDGIELPGSRFNYYTLLTGSGYDLILNDQNVLYGYNLDSGETTEILNWIDSDINANNISNVAFLSDGTILCTGWDDLTGNSQMTALTKTPASEIQEKIVLTYATSYLNYYTRAAIINFNKTNGTYRVKVKDYSNYATEDDYMAGYSQLNMDIISGNIPDIIDLSNQTIENYANKGVLADLYTLMDSDSDISREDFVPGLLQAFETNGKLYSMITDFTIMTVLGLSSVVGDQPGWTFDQMMAAYEKMPEGAAIFSDMTKDWLLSYSLQLSLSQFIDSDTGKCSFNSDGFIKLLEFANSFPEEYDYTKYEDGSYVSDFVRMREGSLMLTQVYLYSFDAYQEHKGYYGDNFTYIGFPTENGNGASFNSNSYYGVSAKSANIEGAWQFIKYLVSDDYQTTAIWSFPVTMSAFSKKAEDYMKPNTYINEDGEEVEYENIWNMDGIEIKMDPLTQEDIDALLAYISSVDQVYNYDNSMMEIITEETAAYFAGQKSASETANLIQNRVQTYISENR